MDNKAPLIRQKRPAYVKRPPEPTDITDLALDTNPSPKVIKKPKGAPREVNEANKLGETVVPLSGEARIELYRERLFPKIKKAMFIIVRKEADTRIQTISKKAILVIRDLILFLIKAHVKNCDKLARNSGRTSITKADIELEQTINYDFHYFNNTYSKIMNYVKEDTDISTINNSMRYSYLKPFYKIFTKRTICYILDEMRIDSGDAKRAYKIQVKALDDIKGIIHKYLNCIVTKAVGYTLSRNVTQMSIGDVEQAIFQIYNPYTFSEYREIKDNLFPEMETDISTYNRDDPDEEEDDAFVEDDDDTKPPPIKRRKDSSDDEMTEDEEKKQDEEDLVYSRFQSDLTKMKKKKGHIGYIPSDTGADDDTDADYVPGPETDEDEKPKPKKIVTIKTYDEPKPKKTKPVRTEAERKASQEKKSKSMQLYHRNKRVAREAKEEAAKKAAAAAEAAAPQQDKPAAAAKKDKPAAAAKEEKPVAAAKEEKPVVDYSDSDSDSEDEDPKRKQGRLDRAAVQKAAYLNSVKQAAAAKPAAATTKQPVSQPAAATTKQPVSQPAATTTKQAVAVKKEESKTAAKKPEPKQAVSQPAATTTKQAVAVKKEESKTAAKTAEPKRTGATYDPSMGSFESVLGLEEEKKKKTTTTKKKMIPIAVKKPPTDKQKKKSSSSSSSSSSESDNETDDTNKSDKTESSGPVSNSSITISRLTEKTDDDVGDENEMSTIADIMRTVKQPTEEKKKRAQKKKREPTGPPPMTRSRAQR